MEYPKGAIKSIAEFQALGLDGHFTVWQASCKFTSCRSIVVNGNIVTTKYPDGYEYVGFQKVSEHLIAIEHSVVDSHLLPQDYNDWFLFVNEDDAREYCAEGVPVTTTGD